MIIVVLPNERPQRPVDVLADDRPMCAVCNKPVDRVERTRDVLRCCTETVFECHGEIERVVMWDNLLQVLSRTDFDRLLARRPFEGSQEQG